MLQLSSIHISCPAIPSVIAMRTVPLLLEYLIFQSDTSSLLQFGL